MTRILTIILFALSGFSHAQVLSGEVTAILDGNTLEFQTQEPETYQVVLLGIDCPELTQPYGIEAKTFLENALLRRQVLFQLHGKDRYKNYIGVVLQENNMDVRLMLLDAGLAWTTEANLFPELEEARTRSARKKKGLWKEGAPVPPWIYRRQQSMTQPKAR